MTSAARAIVISLHLTNTMLTAASAATAYFGRSPGAPFGSRTSAPAARWSPLHRRLDDRCHHGPGDTLFPVKARARRLVGAGLRESQRHAPSRSSSDRSPGACGADRPWDDLVRPTQTAEQGASPRPALTSVADRGISQHRARRTGLDRPASWWRSLMGLLVLSAACATPRTGRAITRRARPHRGL